MDAAASDAPDAELWRLYKDGCIEAQGRLYLRHAPWAKSIAVQIHGRIRAYPVDRQDFIQNATLGLLEAMSRFDPVMGVSFRHYAVARVRGAVFNGLRAILGDRPVAQEDSRMQERVRYDLHYIENWSLLLDLRIIFRTLLVGFSHPNAY